MELLIQVARCLATSAAARLLLPAKQAVPLVLIREPPPIRAELFAGLRRHASVSAPRSLDVHTGRLYLSLCVSLLLLGCAVAALLLCAREADGRRTRRRRCSCWLRGSRRCVNAAWMRRCGAVAHSLAQSGSRGAEEQRWIVLVRCCYCCCCSGGDVTMSARLLALSSGAAKSLFFRGTPRSTNKSVWHPAE